MPRRREVDTWFARYDNPMKPVVQRVRAIVLGADRRMDECIKWQAPTFTYLGNLASFYPKSRQHASLMFHVGAEIPGRYPRLEGTGGTSRVMKFVSVAEADAAARELTSLVKAWCEWREGERSGAAMKSMTSAGRTAKAPKTRSAARKTR